MNEEIDCDDDITSLEAIEERRSIQVDQIEMIEDLRAKMVHHSHRKMEIRVNRGKSDFLNDVLWFYKDTSNDLSATPDITFINESAIDFGGPRKEFLAWAIEVLCDARKGMGLFEGEADHLVLIHNVDALEYGFFTIAGKVIAHSLAHGGPLFSEMAPCTVKYLTTVHVQAASLLVTITDVPDTEIRATIEQVNLF